MKFSKEQAGSRKRGPLLQMWSQTAKSKTTKEDKDEEGAKPQKVLGKEKHGSLLHTWPQQEPTAKSKTTKEDNDEEGANRQKVLGTQKQGTLLYIWPQQKPTSKSRALEEDEEEPTKRIKRQRIF